MEFTKAGQMDEPTVRLHSGGIKPTGRNPTARSRFHQLRTGTMKFTYASGSRPLDGYTIKRGIGSGGFGQVYFATSDTGKEVALKHIQRNLDVELRGVKQCLNLKHPNLVALYNIRYDDHGDGWVVMEYVSGKSLKEVIDTNPEGLPLDQMRHWLQGIATGTAYLHDHGIVHRDLKPGNLFLDGGLVKIGDYGLSKFISVSRRSGQTESVGTFHYMAPEIGKGNYGKEIDIYALGVILFEILTGKVPFDGESSQEIIMKHLTDKPDLTPLPDRFKPVVSKSLAKDPANRYTSVAELAHDLKLDLGSTITIAMTQPALSQPTNTASSEKETLFIDNNNASHNSPPEITKEAVTQFADVEFDKTQTYVPTQHNSKADEPIAAAVRHAWQQAHYWWKNVGLPIPLKFLLLMLMALLLLGNVGWLLPLTVTSIVLYLGYLGLRGLVLQQKPAPPDLSTAERTTSGATLPDPTPFRRRNRHNLHISWQEHCRSMLREKSRRERVMELIGSMLMSVFVIKRH